MSFCSIGLGIVAFGQKSLEQLLGDLPVGPRTFCQSETGTTWKRNQSFVHLFSFSKKSTRIQMTAAQTLLVRQIFYEILEMLIARFKNATRGFCGNFRQPWRRGNGPSSSGRSFDITSEGPGFESPSKATLAISFHGETDEIRISYSTKSIHPPSLQTLIT